MSVHANHNDETLSLFESKEIVIPFTPPKQHDVMRARTKHFTLYGLAFITLLIIESSIFSFVPGVNAFLESNKAVSIIFGAVLMLINYAILYRYMQYADEKISDAQLHEQDTIDALWESNVKAAGYRVAYRYGFNNLWASHYIDEDKVEHYVTGGHYDGKNVHLVLTP